MSREEQVSQGTTVHSPPGWRSKRKHRKKSRRASKGDLQLSHREINTASPTSTELVAYTLSPRGVTEIEGMLQQPVRKHVRFQPFDITGRPTDTFIANDLVPASSMSRQEKREIWWQNSDYQIIKQTGQLMAKEILRRQDGKQRSSPNSYLKILERTYSACYLPDARDDQSPLSFRDRFALQQWAEIGICRRGLEKWSVPDITIDRFKRKDLVIQTVLQLQQRLRMARSRLGFVDHERGEEELMRVASERLTKPARLFAQAMGEADELAVS